MLIGITGPICAGKHTTAEYLVQHHGFLRLHLPKNIISSSVSDGIRQQSRNVPVSHNSLIHTTKPPRASPIYSSTQRASSDEPVDTDPDLDLKRLAPSITDEKGTRGLTFPDVDSLLDFVTRRWREHWVLTDITDETTLEKLLRRPFFLLVSVDAPVGLRYERLRARCLKRDLPPMPLDRFITLNDTQLYGHPSSQTNPRSHSTPPTSTQLPHQPSLHTLLSHSHLQILNPQTTTLNYFKFLSSLTPPLNSPLRLRPSWDQYFMTLASLASLRSNCMKRRVGCVLVFNHRIISTGYNGTPRGLTNCNEGGCARCNDSGNSGGTGLATCLCLHAEENALLEAGRERIRDDWRSSSPMTNQTQNQGCVLYCDTCPCLTCSVKIAQVGVKEVVYSQTYNMDDASRRVLAEAGVTLRQFSPAKGGLVGVGMDEYEGMEDGMEYNKENGRAGTDRLTVMARNGSVN